jgi:hypothetical protein
MNMDPRSHLVKKSRPASVGPFLVIVAACGSVIGYAAPTGTPA